MKTFRLFFLFPVPVFFFLLNLFRLFRHRNGAASHALLATSTFLVLCGLRLPSDPSAPIYPAALVAAAFLLLSRPYGMRSAAYKGWLPFFLFMGLVLARIATLSVLPDSWLPLFVYTEVAVAQTFLVIGRRAARGYPPRKAEEAEDVSVWAEKTLMLCGMQAVLAASVFSLLAPSPLWPLVQTVFLSLFAVRDYLERPFFPDAALEKMLQDLSAAGQRTETVREGDRELYERCCRYMEEKRPYLVESFSIADLARGLYTNKVYLSRTINAFGKKNFRQFVNYYRVKYAIGQFMENKHLRVSEMAELSGFHSTVTFNMAFKLVTGETPSDWKRQQFLQNARKPELRP